ncbi:hypothetical protein BpHYR1_002681 [Brachionus plicatilis]|uniref:Uncharacterized protein n=1 Tax=Brachionus plicatilis TaxID=10195 RepID=A0A3M7PMU8_BRAPC|nr:hypothetical protein BpHYR1_002681 [Brachionus plicatilis]
MFELEIFELQILKRNKLNTYSINCYPLEHSLKALINPDKIKLYSLYQRRPLQIVVSNLNNVVEFSKSLLNKNFFQGISELRLILFSPNDFKMTKMSNSNKIKLSYNLSNKEKTCWKIRVHDGPMKNQMLAFPILETFDNGFSLED